MCEPVFSAKLDGILSAAPDVLKEAFINIIRQVSFRLIENGDIHHYSTDKRADYRFSRRYVFCAMTPKPGKCEILIELRNDDVKLRSEIVKLIPFDMNVNNPPPGKQWVRFFVTPNSEDQIQEAIRIIVEVCQQNSRIA